MVRRFTASLFVAALTMPTALYAQKTVPLPPRPATARTVPSTQPTAPAAPRAIDNEDRDPIAEMSGTRLEKRAKLRACATEWEGMKRAQKDAGRTWRDFSVDCLLNQRQGSVPPNNRPPG